MKNRNILISIVLVIIGILLIGGAFVINLTSKEKDNEKTNGNENNNVDNTVVYSCKTLIAEEGNVDFTSYKIEKISVLDDRVLRSESIIEILCNSEEVYLNFKTDENYSANKEFIDSEKKITFSNGEMVDFTKDINGQDMTLKFSDYKTDLEKVGYTCVQE